MSEVETSDGQEPSMEEILASIRRIIADEKDPVEEVAGAASEGVAEEAIDLTDEIKGDDSSEEIDLADDEPEAVSEPESELEPKPRPISKPVMAPIPVEPEDDSLVSDDVAGAAASSLSELANTVEIERRAAGMVSLLGNGRRTLEDMAMELMRPLLREWLDANLPPIVEKAVQKEVERISKRVSE